MERTQVENISRYTISSEECIVVSPLNNKRIKQRIFQYLDFTKESTHEFLCEEATDGVFRNYMGRVAKQDSIQFVGKSIDKLFNVSLSMCSNAQCFPDVLLRLVGNCLVAFIVLLVKLWISLVLSLI